SPAAWTTRTPTSIGATPGTTRRSTGKRSPTILGPSRPIPVASWPTNVGRRRTPSSATRPSTRTTSSAPRRPRRPGRFARDAADSDPRPGGGPARGGLQWMPRFTDNEEQFASWLRSFIGDLSSRLSDFGITADEITGLEEAARKLSDAIAYRRE